MKKISNKFALTDTGKAMNEINNQREDLEERRRKVEIELEKEDEQSANVNFLERTDNCRMELVIQLEEMEKENKKMEEDREKLVETMLGERMLGNDDDMEKKEEGKKETEKLRVHIKEMEEEKARKEEEEREERNKWMERMEMESNAKLNEEINKKEKELEEKQKELMEQFKRVSEQMKELEDSTAEQSLSINESEQERKRIEQETKGMEEKLDMMEYQLEKGRFVETTSSQLEEQIAAIDELGISDEEENKEENDGEFLGFQAVEVESLVRSQEIEEKIQELEQTVPRIEVNYRLVESQVAESPAPEEMEEGDDQAYKKKNEG